MSVPLSIVPIVPFKNPRRQLTDSVPIWLRVFSKTFIAPLLGRAHHHTIIPETANHSAWVLGAQPWAFTIRGLYGADNKKRVHIVSMLADFERTITENNSLFNEGNQISRMPWFDHGTMSTTTGKNVPVTTMRRFQETLYKLFTENPQHTLFYCHCMAGQSRSFLETLSFIYFYPNKEQLFDFDQPEWNAIWQKIAKKHGVEYTADLKMRLRSNPSLSDIAEFISLRRPQVKKLTKMDGDQAGLLGLMSLNAAAENNCQLIKNKDRARLLKDAQNIGLMLKFPLYIGFREASDVLGQQRDLISVYNEYHRQHINLLLIMVVPIKEQIRTDVDYRAEFENYFRKLAPSEQARFAILAKKLTDAGCNLYPITTPPLSYAKVALRQAKKLTAGDQIELLKTFGPLPNLDYTNIAERICSGSKIDRHHSGTQLAELFLVANRHHIDTSFIKTSLGQLDFIEQFRFLRELTDNDFEIAQIDKYNALKKTIEDNYKNRRSPWTSFFSKPSSIVATTIALAAVAAFMFAPTLITILPTITPLALTIGVIFASIAPGLYLVTAASTHINNINKMHAQIDQEQNTGTAVNQEHKQEKITKLDPDTKRLPIESHLAKMQMERIRKKNDTNKEASYSQTDLLTSNIGLFGQKLTPNLEPAENKSKQPKTEL